MHHKQFNFFSAALAFLLSFFFVGIVSCKNKSNTKESTGTIPIGKWRITHLKTLDTAIILDSTRPYILENNYQNNITLLAEDNRLTGKITAPSNHLFTLEDVTITDVCCNSEVATMLFTFWGDTIHYKQEAHELILSNNKTTITLNK